MGATSRLSNVHADVRAAMVRAAADLALKVLSQGQTAEEAASAYTTIFDAIVDAYIDEPASE